MPADNIAPSAAGTSARPGSIILGMRVDVATYATATARITGWATQREARYVCAGNVHMVMEARDAAEFRALVNRADLVTADGMPLVWLQRRRGFAAERVYGPTLMLHVCEAAAQAGIPIALFGGSEELLATLVERLQVRFPRLQIALQIAPPFGEFASDDNAGFAEKIRGSGAGIVFVGLGCPKQEKWMAAVTHQIPAVLLGVGAAFAFHAGQLRQAPAWIQGLGLEWLFRLTMEPRRLWRRYARHNLRFIGEIWREEFAGDPAGDSSSRPLI